MQMRLTDRQFFVYSVIKGWRPGSGLQPKIIIESLKVQKKLHTSKKANAQTRIALFLPKHNKLDCIFLYNHKNANYKKYNTCNNSCICRSIFNFTSKKC